MTEKVLLVNGTHSLTRYSGEIFRVGSGRDISTRTDGGAFWPSIQIRGEDGRLQEIKNVAVRDYLCNYLSPGEKATFYFRSMRLAGKTLNFLVAVKNDEIAIYDEELTKNGAYPRSVLYFSIALLISLPFAFVTLMLLAPVSAFMGLKLLGRLRYQGSIPSHKVIARQVNTSLRDEGFVIA